VSKSPFQQSTVDLTHYGRKSGKPYKVKIWFAVVDGKVWIGSLNRDRGWVRNLRSSGRGELDFGSDRRPVQARYTEDARDIERFGAAILRKYWLLGRILTFVVRTERCAFETDLAVAGR
jgi:deazaflavin-dependent oxidoreductase (nitroreductase family)